ncbi:MAG: FtsX-like permease family protein [Bacteroidetes bacterium]|nr:FtsX-like permease family protein [Bacteroidota bacterium]
MNFRDNLSMSLRSIGTNQLRTILTMLIIGIGICALVGIQTSLSGLRQFLNSDFASMGSNSFNIRWGGAGAEGNDGGEASAPTPITYRQAMAFQDKFGYPSVVSVSVLAKQSSATIKYLGKKTNPTISVFGVDDAYLDISGYEIGRGRWYSSQELTRNAMVTVLGGGVAKRLFGDNTNPINEFVNIDGLRFRVIGVLESKGVSIVASDDIALVPLSTARAYMIREQAQFAITVKVGKPTEIDAAIGEATGLFRQVRGLNIKEKDDFEITRSDSIAAMLVDMLGKIGIGGTAIGLFTILGAAIGLMNILLVSVNERTREIGLNMAIGARRSSIMMQFLTESVLICMIGGFIGIVLGILIGNQVALGIGSQFTMPWMWIGIGLSICVVVGLGAGIYPAIKASRLDPIEALRTV